MTDNVPAIVRYDGDDGVQERFEHGRHVLLQTVALFGCESALPHKTKLKERRSFCCSRLKERRNSSPISPFPRKRRFSGERNFDTLTPLRSQPQKSKGGLRRISSPLVAINVVENADLDPEPFFLFNSSSKLNFLRSRHVSIVAKVFEILSPKKSRAGVA